MENANTYDQMNLILSQCEGRKDKLKTQIHLAKRKLEHIKDVWQQTMQSYYSSTNNQVISSIH